MAETERGPPPGDGPLKALRGLDGLSAPRGPAPVHRWNPPDCGDIAMRIARDGTWFYQNSPIGRAPLVKLFSSILRKDGGRHVLVTPVEKVGIEVEDAPFLGVELQRGDAGTLRFRSNVDEWTSIDAEHPLRFERGAAEGLKPYYRVRSDLWALVKRALFYDLVALGETREIDGQAWFGVVSAGIFFKMAPAKEIEGL
jgi:uncharacterized protein